MRYDGVTVGKIVLPQWGEGRIVSTMAKTAAKIVVITGVTRGLGRAMAEEFARIGHTVIGCGRTEKAVAELRSSLPKEHDFTALDVADDPAVKA